MIMSNTTFTCKIFIHGKRITQVENLNYLGSTVTFNHMCDEDIKIRIAFAKASFTNMFNILKSGKLSIETNLKFLAAICYQS